MNKERVPNAPPCPSLFNTCLINLQRNGREISDCYLPYEPRRSPRPS